jgi:microcystin-dependent protein
VRGIIKGVERLAHCENTLSNGIKPLARNEHFRGENYMEPFLGQIQLLPYNFAPHDWALCDGQTLQISQNTALFALLGTNFGGDGRTTFALPKLAGPAASVAYYIALQGIFPARD